MIVIRIHRKAAIVTRKFDSFPSFARYRGTWAGVVGLILIVQIIFQLNPGLSLLEHFTDLWELTAALFGGGISNIWAV
jgi:hypothetical protein